MNKTVIVAVVVLVTVGTAVPAIINAVGALVPLLLLGGAVIALLRLVWYMTDR